LLISIKKSTKLKIDIYHTTFYIFQKPITFHFPQLGNQLLPQKSPHEKLLLRMGTTFPNKLLFPISKCLTKINLLLLKSVTENYSC